MSVAGAHGRITSRGVARFADGENFNGGSASPVSAVRGVYGRTGGVRRFVRCSNAYASSMRRGSEQAGPVNVTPNGIGFGLKPGGIGAPASFGTRPNGTTTLG